MATPPKVDVAEAELYRNHCGKTTCASNLLWWVWSQEGFISNPSGSAALWVSLTCMSVSKWSSEANSLMIILKLHFTVVALCKLIFYMHFSLVPSTTTNFVSTTAEEGLPSDRTIAQTDEPSKYNSYRTRNQKSRWQSMITCWLPYKIKLPVFSWLKSGEPEGVKIIGYYHFCNRLIDNLFQHFSHKYSSSQELYSRNVAHSIANSELQTFIIN